MGNYFADKYGSAAPAAQPVEPTQDNYFERRHGGAFAPAQPPVADSPWRDPVNDEERAVARIARGEDEMPDESPVSRTARRMGALTSEPVDENGIPFSAYQRNAADAAKSGRRLPGNIVESAGQVVRRMGSGIGQFLADRTAAIQSANKKAYEGYETDDPAIRAQQIEAAADAENVAAEADLRSIRMARQGRLAREGYEASIPEDAGPIERAIQQGGSSALVSLPTIIAAGPAGGAALLGAGTAGDRYAELIAAGVPQDEAAYSGALLGLLEGLTEFIPGKVLMKNATGFWKKAGEFVATDLAGENINTVTQIIDDYRLGLRDDVTGDDLKQAITETTMATIAGGGMQLGAVQLLQSATRLANERAARREQEALDKTEEFARRAAPDLVAPEPIAGLLAGPKEEADFVVGPEGVARRPDEELPDTLALPAPRPSGEFEADAAGSVRELSEAEARSRAAEREERADLGIGNVTRVPAPTAGEQRAAMSAAERRAQVAANRDAAVSAAIEANAKPSNVTLEKSADGWTIKVGNDRHVTYTSEQLARDELAAVRAAVAGQEPATVLGQKIEQPAQPTPAQATAGNYKKPPVKWKGLEIKVENIKGSTRSGVDKDGKPWSRDMASDYGYFRGTKSTDGEGVDVYMGPKKTSSKAYIIDQLTPDGLKFDEPKVVIGVASEDAARALYRRHYPKGWKGLGAITPIPVDGLKQWLRSNSTTEPLSWQPPKPKEAPPPKPLKRNTKTPDVREDTILEWLSKHPRGLDLDEAIAQGIDPAVFKDRVGQMPLLAKAFRKGGMTFDEAAEILADIGYPVRDEKGNHAANVLLDRIDDEIRGKPSHSDLNTTLDKRMEFEQYEREQEEMYRAKYDIPEELQDYNEDELEALQRRLDRISEELDERDQSPNDSYEDEERAAIQAESEERPMFARGEEDGQGDLFGERQFIKKEISRVKQAIESKQADMFGAEQESTKDKLKKVEAEKDKKRNEGQESAETGRADDLFSRASKQTDVEDAPRFQRAEKPAEKIMAALSKRADIGSLRMDMAEFWIGRKEDQLRRIYDSYRKDLMRVGKRDEDNATDVDRWTAGLRTIEAIANERGIDLSGKVKVNTATEIITGDRSLVDAAIKQFGTTRDPREAGYILPTGSMLDLSGKREGGNPGVRALDHREVVPENSKEESATRGMLRWMADTGSIRMHIVRDGGVIATIVGRPTDAALRQLAKVSGDDLTVSVHGTEDLETIIDRKMSNVSFGKIVTLVDQALAGDIRFQRSDETSEYGIAHRPPGPDDGAPLHDLTGGGNIYPDDIYSAKAAQYYGHHGANDPVDRKTINIIQSFRGKPNAKVTIYRAIPKELTNDDRLAVLELQLKRYRARGTLPAEAEGKYKNGSAWYEAARNEQDALMAKPAEPKEKRTINRGDWVTVNRDYAKEHGESQFDGEYAILSKTVKAREIFTNGDSIHEFGYWPTEATTGKDKQSAAMDERLAGTKVIDKDGKPLRVYHGTGRGDLLARGIRASKAISGPMPYFTESAEIASSYAQGKASITEDEDAPSYQNWFQYKPKGAKTPESIVRMWHELDIPSRHAFNKKILDIAVDEDGKAYDAGPRGGLSPSTYEWNLTNVSRHNGFAAAIETYVTSGALFDNEHEFMRVLKLAGVDTSKIDYVRQTGDSAPAVVPVYLAIRNPLETDKLPDGFIDRLAQAVKRKRDGGGDRAGWDKTQYSSKEWVEQLRADLTEKKNSYVWTAIPDNVTKAIAEIGYDGIKDTGGKSGAHGEHTVWIPFKRDQVVSATGKKDVLFERAKDDTKGMTSEKVESVIKAAYDELAIKPPFLVAKNIGDLPKNVREILERFGFTANDPRGAPKAFYWKGGIYYLSDMVESEQALRETVLHETVIHFGLDAMLDRGAKNEILDGIAKTMPMEVMRRGVKEYGRPVRDGRGKVKSGYNHANDQMRRGAAEEVVAYYGMKYLEGETIPARIRRAIDRVIAAIRDVVRRVLGLDAKQDMIYVRKLLQDLQAYLRSGEAKGMYSSDAPMAERFDDQSMKRFSIDTGIMGVHEHAPVNPVPTNGGNVVSSQIVVRRIRVPKNVAQRYGIQEEMHAFRVSVARRGSDSWSVVETMSESYRRNDDGSLQATFSKLSDDAVDLPELRGIRNIARDMWQDAQMNQDQGSLFERAEPTFYSALTRAAEDAKTTKAPAAQWLATLKNTKGVKTEEIEWSGVEEWLRSQSGAVTKDALVEYLRANEIEVQEVVKGGKSENLAQQEHDRLVVELTALGYTPDIHTLRSEAALALDSNDGNERWLLNEGENAIRVDGDATGDEVLPDMVEALANDLANLREQMRENGDITSVEDDSETRYSRYKLPGGPLSRDTEILTDTGWVRIDAIRLGERIMTRRDEDGGLEWQPVTAKPYIWAESLYHFKNQSIDMMVTPCHQMVVKRRRRSKENGIVRMTAEKLWKTSEMVVPLTGVWSDGVGDKIFGLDAGDVAELVGWYLAEGSYKHRNGFKNTIQIAQSDSANNKKCERIAALLTRLGLKFKYYGGAFGIGIRNMPHGLKTMLHGQPTSHWKYVPTLFFYQKKEVIERLLEGMILGDGVTVKAKGARKAWVALHTSSEKLAGDAQALALMVGKRASVRKRANSIYTIRFAEKQWASVDDAKRAVVPYGDYAFCVTVENHSIYVRRNGIAAFTGNSNYRELLLTLPRVPYTYGASKESKAASMAAAEYEARAQAVVDQANRGEYPGGRNAGLEEADRIRDEKDRVVTRILSTAPKYPNYRSSHWGESNILAHVRFDERTDADGKRVLHVAEIQSDWHQKGRDLGYYTPEQARNAKPADLGEFAGQRIEGAANPVGVPDAPFKTTWPELAFKRVLRYAAENGFDRVTWDTGATNADRYDLSKQLTSVEALRNSDGTYSLIASGDTTHKIGGNIQENKLADYVGNDLAEKIKKQGAGEYSYSGLDLKVGGEGMIEFYDRILPSMVTRYTKKWGATVSRSSVDTKERGDGWAVIDATDDGNQQVIERFGSEVEARAALGNFDGGVDVRFMPTGLVGVHALEITQDMRDTVMQGQPLFQRQQEAMQRTLDNGSPEHGWYKERAQRLIDTWNRKIGWRYGALGHLPEAKNYLVMRYKTLGGLSQVREITRNIFDTLKAANETDAKAVYDFMTTAGASPDAIENEKVRSMAMNVKELIDAQGQALVQAGLLPEESYERYKDSYLPRLYLRHVLADGQGRTAGSGKKLSDLGYLKKRKDIPEEVRQVLLGEITDPAFLAAFGVSRTMRDLAIMNFLQQISRNKSWVPESMLIDFDGKKVTPYWLKNEAEQLRKQADHIKQVMVAGKARAIADRMETLANQAMEALGAEDLGDFLQIPDSPRYGLLRGAWVRKEIHEDLVGAYQFVDTSSLEGVSKMMADTFGRGGRIEKAGQLWKMSKVGLNIPSHFRNMFGNAIMLHLSGVQGWMLPTRFTQAINSIATKDQYYQIAVKYGLKEATFANTELYRIRDEWLLLQKTKKPTFHKLHAMLAHVGQKIGDVYQFEEALFKIMKLRDEMEKGASEADAMIESHKWVFDYSLVPQAVRYLRNASFGSPFLSYAYFALPRLAETAAKRPWKFLPYMALTYALQEAVMNAFGADDDELEKLRNAFPNWMQSRGSMLLYPEQDERGRWNVVDFGYTVPWGNLADMLASAQQGEFGKMAEVSGVMGGPIPDIVAALTTGIDPFTQRQIMNPGDPKWMQAQAGLAYAYNMAAPGFISTNGALKKIADAYTGHVDPRSGEPQLTTTQAWLRLFGVNVYPVDPEATRAANMRFMEYEIREVEMRLGQQLKDKNLTHDQKREIRRVYREEINRRKEALKEYREGSRIPDKLKRGVNQVDERISELAPILDGKNKTQAVAALRSAGYPAFAGLLEEMPARMRPVVADALKRESMAG